MRMLLLSACALVFLIVNLASCQWAGQVLKSEDHQKSDSELDSSTNRPFRNEDAKGTYADPVGKVHRYIEIEHPFNGGYLSGFYAMQTLGSVQNLNGDQESILIVNEVRSMLDLWDGSRSNLHHLIQGNLKISLVFQSKDSFITEATIQVTDKNHKVLHKGLVKIAPQCWTYALTNQLYYEELIAGIKTALFESFLQGEKYEVFVNNR